MAAFVALLFLLPAGGLSGSGCGKKKVDPNQPSAAERAITEYQAGALMLESGRYEEAVASFNKALALDEGNILCHYSLALACLRLGRLDEAMAEADRALELKPSYTEVHNIKGMIYNEQGQYLKAMESFRQLLDTPSYGKPWIAYYNIGFAAASAGNQDEALFYYTQALELKEDYVQARHQRGLMLERLGREAEAMAEYETVLAAMPDSPEVHFSLARLYFRAGRAMEARLNFEWVMRYAPGTDYSSQSARYLNMMEQSGH
jgi:Tfp pilus assembly protein PilF